MRIWMKSGGFIFMLLFATLHVFAHDPISSWSVVRLHADQMELKVEMAAESAWRFIGELNSAPDVGSSLPRLKAQAPNAYKISAHGETLVPREIEVELSEEDGVVLRLVFPPPRQGPLFFDATYLKRLPRDHRTTLTLIDQAGAVVRTELLTLEKPSIELPLPPSSTLAGLAPSALTPAPVPSQPTTSFPVFFKLGIEHILTGYDHLLFLCGLLVVCRSLSSALGIITCFTVAHSLTLALAALGLVTFPGRFVEPLIAASIVFVGTENLLRRGGQPKGRWGLTFVFGLIHGFGFARVLQEIGLGAGGSSIVAPLFAFNFGVELGQAAVAAVFLPLVWRLRTRPTFLRYGEPSISAVVLLLGAYWLLQRTVFS